MTVDATVKVVGLTEALVKISKVEGLFDDFSKPFDQVIIQMQSSFAESFREGGREGEWEDNAEATEIIKKSSKPLIDDRFLELSLTGVTSDSVIEKGKQTLEFGTTREYADIVEEGARIAVTPKMRAYMASQFDIALPDEIVIPPRPFMFFTEKDIQNIETIFETWMQAEVTKIAGE